MSGRHFGPPHGEDCPVCFPSPSWRRIATVAAWVVVVAIVIVTVIR